MQKDMVPLKERLRYLQLFRVAAVALLAIYAAVGAEPRLDIGAMAPVAGGYLAVTFAGGAVWSAIKGRGLLLFGGLLLIDGAFLGWVAHSTGGSLSPFRYMILIHLIVVTLLASYRTGLKLAFWHSVLLFVVYHAEEVGWLKQVEAGYTSVPGTTYARLSIFIVAFWVVALATATFSAINERELRRRKLDVEALAALAERLTASNEPAAIPKLLVEAVVEELGYKRAVLFGAPEGDPFVLAHAGPGEPELVTPGVDDIVKEVMTTQKTLLRAKLSETGDPRSTALLPNAANVVVVPLRADGQTIGALIAEHSFRAGSRIEERVVTATEQFAAHTALALKNAWLLAQMQDMAVTDALTRVYNRRYFTNALQEEINRAHRGDHQLSLVMFDIDHFKKINDTHGHQVGDEVLKVVGKALKDTCRDFDTIARYGGEEFAVILPTTSVEVAYKVAERLRGAIASADTPVPITTSAGVSVFPTNATSPEDILKAADDALYESKRAGRDRVTISEARLAPVPLNRY